MRARYISPLLVDIFAGELAVARPHARVIEGRDPSANISDLRKSGIVFNDGAGSDSHRLFESVRGLVGIQ
jgi:hypothetical protein